jgi:hypothetical protein
VFAEIPVESAWVVPVSPHPPGVGCFSGHFNSSELGSMRFQTFEIQGLLTSSKKFLYFHFCFCVSYTKNALKCAQSSEYVSLTQNIVVCHKTPT